MDRSRPGPSRVELVDLSNEVAVKLSSKLRRADVQNEWDGRRSPSRYEITEFVKTLIEKHARYKTEDLIIDGRDPKLYEVLRIRHAELKKAKDSDRWNAVVNILFPNKEARERALESLGRVSKTALRGVVMRVKCTVIKENSAESRIFDAITETKFQLMPHGRRPDTICLHGVPRNWFGVTDRPINRSDEYGGGEKNLENATEVEEDEVGGEKENQNSQSQLEEKTNGQETALDNEGKNANMNNSSEMIQKKKSNKPLIIKRPKGTRLKEGEEQDVSIDRSTGENRNGKDSMVDMSSYDSKVFYIPGDKDWSPSKLTLDLRRFPNPTVTQK